MNRLEWRLPAAIAALLLVVSGTLAALTVMQSRRAAVASSAERLEHLARQLSANLEQNLATLRRQAAASAAASDVIAALAGARDAAAVGARFAPELTAVSQPFAVELWRATGEVVFAVSGPNPPTMDATWGGFPKWASADEVTMSPPQAAPGGGAYAIAAPVRLRGQTQGYFVTRRRVVSPTNSGQIVSDLIGPENRLMLGRPDGVWLDLLQRDAAPVIDAISADSAGVYWTTDAGGRWMGAVADVAGTPWRLRVESPEAAVFTQSRTMLRNSVGIALLVTALGALGALVVSRRLIGPLRALTQAAVEVSEGTATPKVPFSTHDEIGQLAAAFNVMAARVSEGRRDLETRVAERTDELASAVAQLRDYARQLERSNQELEAFSYTISHDLRAPLRSIDGFSEALLIDCHAQLDDTGRSHLMRIRRAAKRMDELINDLLELARVSRIELTTRPVALDVIVERSVKDLRERDRGREVEVRIQPSVTAIGDSRLLSLVLQNLIENAWKFTSTRAGARIEFGVDPDREPTTYFVRDNGVGFDMAHAGKLFGIFQRLHSLDEFPGTGVGLAIVRRIIERHGGRIWVDARPDAGAAFYFTLEAGHG